jgi:glycerophosphoryl diester phosphodiesterase
VEIIAHRGASHDAPENTLAAVRLAWEQNADAVEVDVHLTRDGRLAVIHDSDTLRTTGTRGLVSERDLAELQQLDAGAWKAAEFSGERIPVLDDVLALVPQGKRIFIELKGGPDLVPELARCLARTRLSPAQVAIISFDYVTARVAKRQLSRYEVCWILERDSADGRRSIDELVHDAKSAELDGLDLEGVWVNDTWVQQITAAGFKWYVWTIDEARLARRLVEAGVNGITTNRPGWLREQL